MHTPSDFRKEEYAFLHFELKQVIDYSEDYISWLKEFRPGFSKKQLLHHEAQMKQVFKYEKQLKQEMSRRLRDEPAACSTLGAWYHK